MDRIAPTHRPAGPNAGTQRWRQLLFLHWPVPAAILREQVPRRLELDLLDGEGLVGLVPFSMHEVRPSWLPRWAALDFLETNVRTYVHHRGVPGVYFFSLDAASRLAVLAARATFGLPYFHADMQLREGPDGLVDYVTRRRSDAHPGLEVRYRRPDAGLLRPSTPGTAEHFLLERYILFVERGGRLLQAQVHHPPYPAAAAEVLALRDELVAAAGLPAVGGPPAFAHYSPGVDVEVFAPELAER